MNAQQRFDQLDISVAWRDVSAYGSAVSGRLQATVRERLYPQTFALLSAEMAREPRQRTRHDAQRLADLVRAERAAPAHRAIAGDEAFWQHDPADVEPVLVTLRASDASAELRLAVDAARCRELRAELSGSGSAGSDLTNALARLIRPLQPLAPAPRAATPPGEPLLVGHACVSWTDGALRLWSDPFLRPKRQGYPARFAPLSPLDFGEREHAVILTHAHPDHFDPGSLFWFPNETAFIVPAADRETPLSIRLDVRLRQLGFTNVTVLRWYETCTVGAFEVTALPFFGEQPLGPDARSAVRPGDRTSGNTYLVRSERGGSALLLADSGADPAGSIIAEARAIRARFGAIDTVFSNDRRWRLYPPQYLVSSVPHYLCYVPDAELAAAQSLMLESDDVWALADALGARRIVPYAMGGAPWFAELGLGFDPFRRRRRTAFDTLPADFAPPADPDTLVAPAATAVHLQPGQGLGSGGAWWLPGRGLPAASEFAPHPPPRVPRALAFSGTLPPQLVPDLVELTRIDPGSWVVAGPDFCEIATGTARALCLELARRLDGGSAAVLAGATPVCMGAFAAHSLWRQLFARVHRAAFAALRDDADPLPRLSALCRSAPFAGLPPPLLERIALELVGVRLDVAALNPSAGRAPRDQRARLGAAPLHLPPQSAEPVARYGSADVGCALLLVKLIHNLWLTSCDARRSLADDEPALYHLLLGRPANAALRYTERKTIPCSLLQSA